MPNESPVLVVDDDAISRRVLRAALSSAGLESEFVTSGAEALGWIERATPCLVLLDLVMPPPDGYTVLREMRSRPETHDVPIVVLTAVDDDNEVTRAFEAGADDFLRKPFRPAELVARIRGQLRLREYVETIAQRSRDAGLLLEVTQALASSLDLRDILHTVVRRVAEVTGVDRCSIVLVREGGDVGYVVASSDDGQVHNLPLDLEKYPEIRRVLDSNEPLVIDDAATHPLYDMLRREAPPHGYASLAIVPILFEGKPMGVLFLRSRARTRVGPHALALTRTIANATAVALRNARILQSLRDKTEEITVARFEAERRLRLTERYADFFESAADGIMVVDHGGMIGFSNPRAHEILGYTAARMGEMRLQDMIVPSDADAAKRVRDAVLHGARPIAADLAVIRGDDGRQLTLSTHVALLRDADDAILVSFRDVTEERRTAEELHKTKGFLERVIESSADAIVSADLRGNVLLYNRAAERVFGYAADEAVGRLNAEQVYPRGVARQIMKLVRENEGRLEAFRTDIVDKTGERVPVSMSAAFILDAGKVVGSVGVFTDLRDRIWMESRLVAAQEELKIRERQAIVAELAGAAAHELNQPLTSVMGYAELLKRKLDRESPSFAAAEVIVSEAERMAEIVRKIGKITRYETKSYVGHAKILDLDKSSGEPDAESPADPSSTRLP